VSCKNGALFITAITLTTTKHLSQFLAWKTCHRHYVSTVEQDVKLYSLSNNSSSMHTVTDGPRHWLDTDTKLMEMI